MTAPRVEAEEFSAAVSGMHCAGCVAAIERAVGQVEGVAEARVNLATEGLWVRFDAPADATAAIVSRIREAVASAGDYSLASADAPASPESRFARPALALALAGTAMAVSMSPVGDQPAGRALAAICGSVVFLGFGAGFVRSFLRSLRARSFGMDSLIGLGAGTAWGASVAGLFFPGAPLFFDTAALIVAIVGLGRSIEARARGRASDALRRLLAFAPDRAAVLRAGGEGSVPVEQVRVGERIVVRPGERVPLDGRILRGDSTLDESALTGESLPVERGPSDAVSAGAMNRTGALHIEVMRPVEESALRRIAEAVRRAQAERIPMQRAADRAAAVLVPVVMAAAGLTAALWLALGDDAGFALARAVAVLVVACPCALGLAAPIAVLIATGRSARAGILFRSGAALEALAAVRVVALDKTGTLTRGEPTVSGLSPAPGVDRDELLRAAASAEQGSEHPLGRALVAHARAEGLALAEPLRVEALPGRGLVADFEGGDRVLVGSPRLIGETGEDAAPGRLAVAEDDAAPGRLAVAEDASPGRLAVARERAGERELLGRIGFRDRPRPEAREVVRRLEADGFAVALVSGDAPGAVASVAEEVGIGRAFGGLLPEEKLEVVDRLRAELGPVAMVGDGVNDAPALARADVGLALAAGTDIARHAAGVTLMRADLRLVPEAARRGRRAVRVIRQNLFWAFFYNLAAVPLAAGAFYPATGALLAPEVAAAAMALSSLSVVGNALRLGSG